ncbi:MAG: DUF547 domain-containing protein [Candidatus Competibacterales bacterium]
MFSNGFIHLKALVPAGVLWAITLNPVLASQGFDHQHSQWSDLLKDHVVWVDDGHASQVDYRGFQADRQALQNYLEALSGVTSETFDTWTREQQMAFLINAYNAFTVELILTEYPELDSIKELGSWFQSPWKREFFTLLGEERHLDWVEHEVLRPQYRDPFIHVGVNCASIGCPALRDEAFVATRLEEQLQDSWRRFLTDDSRNRYNLERQRLEVSKIFDWFEEDFQRGERGFDSLEDTFAPYAEWLADDPEHRARIAAGEAPVAHLSYDWGLNDLKP